MISKAKRKAIEDEVTAIRPVRVDGKDTYVMVIDHWQARDLRADSKWLEAQQHANIRGNKNPIFSGAIGIWDGVVVHENGRVPRTNTGSGGTTVGHALLLGAQSIHFVPIPNSKYKFTLMYVEDIAELTEDDKSPLPTDFDDFLVEYASIRLQVGNEYDMTQEQSLIANIYAQLEKMLTPPPVGFVVRGYY